MVGDVPLDAAGDPGADEADERGCDDVLMVDEVVVIGLVQRGEEPAADLISVLLSADVDGEQLTQMQIDRLSQLRRAYEELAEVYDAMRRLVERGYLAYSAPEKGG